MTDAQREERAIWKLGQAGYTVRREGRWWIVRDPRTAIDTASMDNLAALVELANAIYADHWTGRKEKRAIWELGECGYDVRRKKGGERDGWWVVEDKVTGRELASMAGLAGLVELADLLYEGHWTRRRITPSV